MTDLLEGVPVGSPSWGSIPVERVEERGRGMGSRIRLSVQDGMFLLAETHETPMHVGGLQIFQLPPRAPAGFVATLFARLRAFPVSVPG